MNGGDVPVRKNRLQKKKKNFYAQKIKMMIFKRFSHRTPHSSAEENSGIWCSGVIDNHKDPLRK